MGEGILRKVKGLVIPSDTRFRYSLALNYSIDSSKSN